MTLTKTQVMHIDRRCYSFEQNWRFDQYLFGEPILSAGVLSYQSGCDRTIVAYQFEDEEELRNVILSGIHEVESGPIDSLKVFGAEKAVNWAITSAEKFGLEVGFYYKPDVESPELIMRRDSASSIGLRAARAGRSAGIAVSQSTDRTLSREHLDIFQTFLHGETLSPIDRAYYFLLPTIITRTDIVLLDAFLDDGLVGFAVVQYLGDSAAAVLMHFHKTDLQYVTDVLYEHIIENIAKHRDRVFLGPAIDPGIERFKLKWSRFADVSPTYSAYVLPTKADASEYARHLGIWWYRRSCEFWDSKTNN